MQPPSLFRPLHRPPWLHFPWKFLLRPPCSPLDPLLPPCLLLVRHCPSVQGEQQPPCPHWKPPCPTAWQGQQRPASCSPARPSRTSLEEGTFDEGKKACTCTRRQKASLLVLLLAELLCAAGRLAATLVSGFPPAPSPIPTSANPSGSREGSSSSSSGVGPGVLSKRTIILRSYRLCGDQRTMNPRPEGGDFFKTCFSTNLVVEHGYGLYRLDWMRKLHHPVSTALAVLVLVELAGDHPAGQAEHLAQLPLVHAVDKLKRGGSISRHVVHKHTVVQQYLVCSRLTLATNSLVCKGSSMPSDERNWGERP